MLVWHTLVTVALWFNASTDTVLFGIESILGTTAATVPEWAASTFLIVKVLELILTTYFADR